MFKRSFVVRALVCILLHSGLEQRKAVATEAPSTAPESTSTSTVQATTAPTSPTTTIQTTSKQLSTTEIKTTQPSSTTIETTSVLLTTIMQETSVPIVTNQTTTTTPSTTVIQTTTAPTTENASAATTLTNVIHNDGITTAATGVSTTAKTSSGDGATNSQSSTLQSTDNSSTVTVSSSSSLSTGISTVLSSSLTTNITATTTTTTTTTTPPPPTTTTTPPTTANTSTATVTDSTTINPSSSLLSTNSNATAHVTDATATDNVTTASTLVSTSNISTEATAPSSTSPNTTATPTTVVITSSLNQSETTHSASSNSAVTDTNTVTVANGSTPTPIATTVSLENNTKPIDNSTLSTSTTTTAATTTTKATTTTPPDPCSVISCVNGTCEKLSNGTAHCNCTPGFSGANCSTNIDECASSPCINGSCIDGINSYKCNCTPGYNGTNCDHNIDECASSPCINGSCIDGINSYTCNCTPGYNGTNCDHNIDECLSSPCKNGFCIDGINRYTCNCTAGYSGTNCDHNIDECASSPCVHGSCIDGINRYTCNCTAGYNGTNCDNDIDDCANSPCTNNGTCRDGVNDYTCSCQVGYTGKNCTEDLDECKYGTHNCDDNANCTNTRGSFSCACFGGFTGDGKKGNCKDINECDSNHTRCVNGRCFNTPGSFRCYCNKEWTGQECDTDIDECASSATNSCGDICTNTNGNYSCSCRENFRPTINDSNKCVRKVLLDVHYHHNQAGDDEVIGPFAIPDGIFYFGKIYNSLYVSMNGYVTLGKRLSQKYSPADWKKLDFPVIAPYWADIQTNGSTAGVFISNSVTAEELENIQKALNISEKLSKGIVISWMKAVPFPYSQNWKYEEANFQIIICAAGTTTYLMFNYDQEIFTWQKSSGRNVTIGYTDDSDNFKTLITDFTSANSGKMGSDVPGRWITKVTLTSGAWEAESACLQALEKNTELIAEPCPCSEMQAQRDMRFELKHSIKTIVKYTSRFTFQPQGHRQQCNYIDGSLLRGSPNGGFPSYDETEDAYTKCCVNSTKYCNLFYENNPSDDCLNYAAPTWSLSWGDPHLTTLDGAEYTFNGRGEYTLLSVDQNNISMDVQVRTELYNSSNTDATVFTGIAAKENNGSTVELFFDQAKIFQIYINKTARRSFNIGEHLDRGLYMYSNETNTMLMYKSGLVIQIKQSKILDIVVAAPKTGDFKGTTRGLLGNNNGDKSDDFITKNGTTLPNNSSEEALYSFGTSWRITKEESLFGYYTHGYDFSFFNNDTIKPAEFIGDINITKYISDKCHGLSINLSSCGGDKSCMIDTAATCSIAFGDTSKTSNSEAKDIRQQIENTPPQLAFPDPLYIGFADNTSMGLTIMDKDISYVNCTIIGFAEAVCNKSYIFWNGSNAGRNSILEISVTANDTLGASSIYRPKIYYCGCAHAKQCDYSLIMQNGLVSGSDVFYRANCNCSEEFGGDFCEKAVSICDREPCYNGVQCNSSLQHGKHCGPCPAGLTGDGSKCYEFNYCFLGKDNCTQICENRPGSFECRCHNGYQLSSNGSTCNDIDECRLNSTLCSDNQYCNNTIGSYACVCLPGYAADNNTGKCVNVKANQASYGGIVVFKTDSQDSSQIKNALVRVLKKVFSSNTLQLDFVEIMSVSQTNILRRKRATDGLNTYQSEYLLHLKTKTGTGILQEEFTKSFNGIGSDVGGFADLSVVGISFPFLISKTKSMIYTEMEGGLCNITAATDCDPVSTQCLPTNGSYECHCKDGFAGWENPYTSCKDIDECAEKDKVCSGGIDCTNTPGSFLCKCKNGYAYDQISKGCKDSCASNPCQNSGTCTHGNMEGQYVCKCDDKWMGLYCEKENAEAQKLKTIAIAVGASIGGVCLILIFALLGMYRRHKNRYSGYARRPLSAYDFDSTINFGQTELRTKDFPIDDDTSTSFSIPRPKVKENGSGNTNTDYSVAEGETGKMEDPKQPLTKTTEEIPADGKENPSFLHNPALEGDRRSAKRQSKNPYEYF